MITKFSPSDSLISLVFGALRFVWKFGQMPSEGISWGWGKNASFRHPEWWQIGLLLTN